jgi:multidrug resistance efflux pump
MSHDSNQALSVLVGVARRARHAASVEELTFVMVNETKALIPYAQAVLWSPFDGVVAVSAVATIDSNAPFPLWLDRLLRRHTSDLTEPRLLRAADDPEWNEWLPPHLLALPLKVPDGEALGVLALVRDEEWSEAEILFAAEAADGYALAWGWRRRPSLLAHWRARWRTLSRRWLYAAAAATLAAAFPVHLSVLAPGEVVARDAAVVRAPLEGVVEKVQVTPNQRVENGQLLFELNTTTIRGKLDVAAKALATAKAEYDQSAQQAFFDPKAKAQLGVLSGHIEEKQAELAYLSEMLERSKVKAPRAGIAVLDDPTEWIGRPVTTGERVLSVADEHDTEIEAWLAPADAIEVAANAPVTLFLNVDPLHAVHGVLRYITYESLTRSDGTIAHRLRASAEGEHPRLGLKGTVRLDGERVPLIYWLARRPWAVVRQTLGL